ncbi:protein amalgam-like isoform X2 [Littorina saxatilis]|uniref:protein amalgam-like isoform X2 n=1 Tax=Littorina saxatilis TaxID=31220 RepID=UPI0038B4C857
MNMGSRNVFSVVEVFFGLCFLFLWTASGQQFTSSPQTVHVMEGSNVTLQCHLTNLGGMNVFWMHDGTILTFNQLVMRNNGHYVIRGRYNLLMINVTSHDEGEYRCQVSSSPVLEQVSTLLITVPAEIKQFPESPEVETTLGESVTFTCGATGKPTPNITWSTEDQHVDAEENITYTTTTTMTTSTLMINGIKAQDDGIYTCTAFNGVGVADKSSVHLKVLYPPTIHNQTAVIQTGPGQETYLPCVVSAQPEPQVTWFHNGSRLGLRELPQHKEIVVESLVGAKDYRLRIKAVEDSDLGVYVCHVTNNKGEAREEIVLTAKPGKPVILSNGKGHFSDVYMLKWSVSSYVTPLVYSVMIREEDNTTDGKWREVDVKPSPEGERSQVHKVSVSIPDLSHDTTYEVIVRAHNSYGWSDKNDHFVFTTNAAPNGSSSPAESLSLWCCVLHVIVTAAALLLTL